MPTTRINGPRSRGLEILAMTSPKLRCSRALWIQHRRLTPVSLRAIAEPRLTNERTAGSEHDDNAGRPGERRARSWTMHAGESPTASSVGCGPPTGRIDRLERRAPRLVEPGLRERCDGLFGRRPSGERSRRHGPSRRSRSGRHRGGSGNKAEARPRSTQSVSSGSPARRGRCRRHGGARPGPASGSGADELVAAGGAEAGRAVGAATPTTRTRGEQGKR